MYNISPGTMVTWYSDKKSFIDIIDITHTNFKTQNRLEIREFVTFHKLV